MRATRISLLLSWSLVLWTRASAMHLGSPQKLGLHPGVESHYIIQYHEDQDPESQREHETLVHSTATRYSAYRGIVRTFSIGSFKGYHAHLSDEAIQNLNSSSHSHLIKSVYPDRVVNVSSFIPLSNRQSTAFSNTTVPANEANLAFPNIRNIRSATWGQARISHRRPNATSYTYDDGSPTVYHIDTGIQVSHSEFSGKDSYGQPRVRWGRNFIPGSPDTDEAGHGTHTAGTIGGVTYGIAPRTRMLAAKVFDGNGQGSWTGIIAALDWACADAVRRNATGLSVINMSLGGGYYQPMNEAVTAAVNAGITVFVSAGNSGVDLKDTSPASCPDAITVGATDEQDSRADFSNWGQGLSFFAPGVGVLSAGIGASNDETAVMSGTSQAAPHVTGLAVYLMTLYGWHTPVQIKQRLEDLATRDMVLDPGNGSPNLIVFNGNSASE